VLRYLKLHYQTINPNKINSQYINNTTFNYYNTQNQKTISLATYYNQDRYRYHFNNPPSIRRIQQQRGLYEESKRAEEENRQNQQQEKINENYKKMIEEIQKKKEEEYNNMLERRLKILQQDMDQNKQDFNQFIAKYKQTKEENLKPIQETENKDSTKTFPFFPLDIKTIVKDIVQKDLDTRKTQLVQTPEKVIIPNQQEVKKSWDDESSISGEDLLLRGAQATVAIYKCIQIVLNNINNKQVNVPVMIKLDKPI